MSAPKYPGSYRSYLAGFLLSLIFTLAAFFLVTQQTASHDDRLPYLLAVAIITALALAQLAAQLVFFLHLNKESKPRWNMMVLFFAALVVIMVVFGSLWIMHNLDYHHPPASSIDEHIIKDEGISR